MKQKFAALGFALTATVAGAQIPVDLSQAKVAVQDSQTLRLENLSVPGFGSFQLQVQWNPATLSFVPVVSSLVANGAYCEKATVSGNLTANSNNSNTYLLRQRSTPGLTVGALATNNNFASSFTLTWAKTSTAAENPYLTGRTVADFDATKSYGIIGRVNDAAYPRFTQGMLVEVTGGLAAGAIVVKQVGGTASTTFTFAANATQATTNCAATSNGVVSGAMENSNNSRTYQVSVLGGNAGSITTNNNFASAFTATWDGSTTGKRGFNYGVVSVVNDASYARFASQGAVFIADVGDGLTFTAIDAAGVAQGTAAFLKY